MISIAAPTHPTITTLRADLVPHREMAIRKWYCASPLWYYHRRAFPGEFECTRRFYQLIDRELRDLCRLLHESGIHTTPSCQGHFYERDYYKQVWDELLREAWNIRTDGLAVMDSENGREFRFRASTFQLPWANFGSFFSQVVAQQTAGYLGILVPRQQPALVCRLHNDQYRTKHASIHFDGPLSCLLGCSLFAITVAADSPESCQHAWQSVTEYMRSMLGASPEVSGRPVVTHQ